LRHRKTDCRGSTQIMPTYRENPSATSAARKKRIMSDLSFDLPVCRIDQPEAALRSRRTPFATVAAFSTMPFRSKNGRLGLRSDSSGGPCVSHSAS
jgi:hypothetical protein